MNRKNQTILTLIVIIVLITTIFFVLDFIPSEEDKFIGTWKSEDGNLVYTFYDNGTGLFEFIDSRYGTWKVEDGKLITKIDISTYKNNYAFLDDGKVLRIDNLNFTKI